MASAGRTVQITLHPKPDPEQKMRTFRLALNWEANAEATLSSWAAAPALHIRVRANLCASDLLAIRQ